ncbi:Hypothetical predicted protein [Pelobates cultripes]|uniref:Uncharacterized protein n=1 Tax=Pelobates cultripes TaxID=61616 RepID=A0AAD1SAK9_PELCU|nr:Hypothetical predicted protein [Pelobates cultripes]
MDPAVTAGSSNQHPRGCGEGYRNIEDLHYAKTSGIKKGLSLTLRCHMSRSPRERSQETLINTSNHRPVPGLPSVRGITRDTRQTPTQVKWDRLSDWRERVA